MKPNLILIGASVRAAAESARRGGFSVIAIDQFGDADTRLASEQWLPFPSPGQLATTLKPFTGVPIVPAGGFEAFFSELASCCGSSPVLAPGPDAVRLLREPTFLDEVARQSGLDFPPWSPSPIPLVRNLLKNRFGAAGLNVRVVKAQQSPLLNSGDYHQQHRSGKSCGASFLAFQKDVRLLGVCRCISHRQIDLPFLYSGSIGPLAISAADRRRLLTLGEVIHNRTGLLGLFNVDFLHDSTTDKIWLLEINPRYSASMELLEETNSTSSDSNSLIAQHVKAYSSELFSGPELRCADRVQFKRITWARQDLVWAPERLLRGAGERGLTIRDMPNDSRQVVLEGTPAFTVTGLFSAGNFRFAAGLGLPLL